MQAKCLGITRAGKRCQAPRMAGSTYCVHHDPELANERREWSARGGKNKATARRAAKTWKALADVIPAEDLPAKLRSLIPAVESDELDSSQANAIANLAKASVAISTAQGHEDRIARLESALAIVQDTNDTRIISS